MRNRIALLSLPLLALTAPAASFAADNAGPPTEQRDRIARGPLFVGVELIPVDESTRTLFKLPSTGGLLVIGVAPDSPSDGKIGQGDILLKLEDQVIVNREQLRTLIRSRNAGDPAVFTVSRGGRMESVTVKLAPAPVGLMPPLLRGLPQDPARHEELLRKLTERTRRMLSESGLPEDLLENPAAAPPLSLDADETPAPGARIITTRTQVFPEGRVTVVNRDGKVTVTVTDSDGKVLAEGKLTDALRAKVPEWAKPALDPKPDPKTKPDAPVAQGDRSLGAPAA